MPEEPQLPPTEPTAPDTGVIDRLREDESFAGNLVDREAEELFVWLADRLTALGSDEEVGGFIAEVRAAIRNSRPGVPLAALLREVDARFDGAPSTQSAQPKL